MLRLSSTSFNEYQLIDSGDGYRLEMFGDYILKRPDPQAIWKPKLKEAEWQKADASFELLPQANKGRWVKKNLKMPDKWPVKFKELKFWVKLTPFKHTGVFAEQAAHLEWISSVIPAYAMSADRQAGIQLANKEDGSRIEVPTKSGTLGIAGVRDDKQINVLNLFGYTGAASLVVAKMGGKVTHVDASRPAIAWARENQKLSGLEDRPIRWILDDCIKFCQREIKRGNKYKGIIMDPPIYGHGPSGERWEFNEHFPKLLALCRQLLNDRPIFVIVNAYAISSSALMLENVMRDYLSDLGGKVEVGELVLKDSFQRPLSTGIFGRWSSQELSF